MGVHRKISNRKFKKYNQPKDDNALKIYINMVCGTW